jgi:tetratricopeptide (TPR) repeat protein
MHKNFYKILFLFLIVISNLQASKQSENIKFQEQINNLKIEIAVLKSKQEFYDKQNDDKSRILSIEHDLKELEKELNGNKQDTKVFEKEFEQYNNTISRQDQRINDLNFYLAFYGVLLTILLLLTSWGSYKVSSKENKETLDLWINENKDEIINPIKEEAKKWKDEILQEQHDKLKEHNIDEKIDGSYKVLLEKVEEKIEHKEQIDFTYDDWNSKATHEYYNGSKEEAIKYFINAIELESSDFDKAKSLYTLGVISNELNDNENAIKYYKLAIEKEHIGAMNNLANLYKDELNDNENAGRYFRMAQRYEEMDKKK